MANTNDDFKFEQFAVAAIKEIDSLRSTQGFGNNESEAKTGAPSEPRESRLNAFYRAVGLPAIMPEETSDAGKNNPGKRNNGNVYPDQGTFSSNKQALDDRQNDFTKEIEEVEIVNFLDKNERGVIKSSIKPKSDNKRRKRGLLFPMYVDGRIEIQSHAKRVAGAFMETRERKDGKDYYHRPLIETIINIRLTGDNVTDSSSQSGASSDLGSTSGNKVLGEASLDKLIKTLNSLHMVFLSTRTRMDRVRENTGIEIIPTVANVAEQNPKTRINPDKKGKLDVRNEAIGDEKKVKDAILVLVKYQESKKNSGEKVITKNVEEAVLAGSFFEILTPKKETETEEKSERINKELEKNKNEAKAAYKSLDLLLGTFAGISGVDIIVVFAALYAIELDYLLGLLNDEALERLGAIKGESVVSSAQSVESSVAKLEEHVTTIFDYLAKSFDTPTYDSRVEYIEEGQDTNSNAV